MFAIRSAHADDLPAIHWLLKNRGLPIDDVSTAHLSHFLVLHDAASIAGCIGLEPYGAYGLLRSLAVNDALRGNHWGKRLVLALEARARSEGIATLYLLTTTAAPFFEKQGYRRIDRAAAPQALQSAAQFASMCPSSAACLSKSLSSKP